MLYEWVAASLAASLILYCLFAGADFGAGILELFCGRNERDAQRRLITEAVGPVWEANHVWLILAIVILFNGFPQAYAFISTRYHIPLTIMLLGVIMRGCAFTFRHYDAIEDGSRRYYTAIFAASSVLTPLMLGMVSGAVLRDDIVSNGASFYATYVAPWCNGFCFMVGVFTCTLFAFLAATYLVGEADSAALKRIFLQRARAFNIAAVLTGGAVFLTAWFTDYALVTGFAQHRAGLACMLLATLALVPLWIALRRDSVVFQRMLSAGQVALIILGQFQLQYPRIAGELTVQNAAAPDATLVQMLWALGVGALLIVPSLVYLLRIFKTRRTASNAMVARQSQKDPLPSAPR